MNILLFGASGFIGRHIATALRARGHRLTTPNRVQANYRALDENALRPLLEGQDLIINAVGIMHRRADVLEKVHHHAPAQIAAWARAEGVPRFLQLSALGADAAHPVAFVGSKGRGDDALLASGLQVSIARPSPVYGRGGTSSELFIRLARLPVLILPAGGRFTIQPVHIADLGTGMVRLAENAPPHGTIIHMCGARAYTLADYFGILRRHLHGKAPPSIMPLPPAILRPLLPLANYLSNGLLSADNIRLLQESAHTDTSAFSTLLGREPLCAADFFSTLPKAP